MKQPVHQDCRQALSPCDVSFTDLELRIGPAVDLYKSQARPGFKMLTARTRESQKLAVGAQPQPLAHNEISCVEREQTCLPVFSHRAMGQAEAKRCSNQESPFLSRKASCGPSRYSGSLRQLSPLGIDCRRISRLEKRRGIDFAKLSKKDMGPSSKIIEYESTHDVALQQSEICKFPSSAKPSSINASAIQTDPPSLKDQFIRAARLVASFHPV